MTPGDSVNILLIDDRSDALLDLERVLKELGERIVLAQTGDEAIRHVSQTEFAVILLRAGMTGHSDLDLARRIRESTRQTPIILLDDHGDDFPLEDACTLGSVDYLVKPVHPEFLRTKVRMFADLYRRVRDVGDFGRVAARGEQLWRTLIRSIGDAVIATDSHGLVTFLNPVAEDLTGWPLAEARGVPLHQVFHIVNETTRDPVDNPALRSLREGIIVGLANHTILIARDGIERPIDDSAAPIRDDAGAVVGAVLVFRDITDRRRSEEALRESESRHRILAELADATRPLTDSAAIMTAAARLLAEHLEVDRCAYAEVEDEATYNIIEDFARGVPSIAGRWPIAAFGAEHRRMMRAEEPYVVVDSETDPRIAGDELPAYRATDIRAVICVPLHKAGRLTAAMAVHQKTPRRWTHAEVRLVAAVVTRCWDTLERVKAERALAESHARLDYAVRVSGIGFWYCDLPFDELRWDDRVKAHFWLPPDARVTIDTFYDRIHPDDRAPTRAAIERSVDERLGYDVHYRTVDPVTGAEKQIRAMGGTDYDRSGEPRRFDGVTLDVTEQRRAEASLRESSDRFNIVARATNDAVWDWDMRTDAVWWNEGVTTLFGHRPDDVRPDASWWYDHIHPEDRERVHSSIHAVIDHGGEKWSDEYRFLKGDGAYATVLDRGYAIRKDGRTVRLVGAMQDVTERRQAEERMRESERQYRTLFESIDEGFCVIEMLFDDAGNPIDYRFRKVNPIFEKQTGLSDVVGKRMRELVPDHDEHWFEIYGKVATTGESIRFQNYAKALGRYFEVYAFRTGEPSMRKVAILFRDITDRKRSEEAVQFLADASASLAELVDYESTLGRIANLAVGGFADWCVVDMIREDGSRERLAVTGAESDDVSSARWADASSRLKSGSGVVPHVLRSGEPEVVFDLTELDPASAPQGQDRVAKLRQLGIRSYLCVPLVSRGRVIGGMTFLSTSARRRFGPEELRIARNLTERVTVAIENARLYHTLQEQDRHKDEFLATLAHELRNPLAPIRNGLQILRMVGATDSETTGQTLSMMNRQLNHITHLVDDLMDVARVSSGKVALRTERIPLRAVLDAAVETCRQAIEAAGHEFAFRMPDESMTVEGDRTRLVQVLANLLNNAAKYTPHGGRITLAAKRDDDHAAIMVTDTGVGIPPEMLPKVFEMFTQVGTSLERSQGGLGIGLTLVRRLVEMHGGKVAAESAGHGHGSTFIVRLPLAAEIAKLDDEAPGDIALHPAQHLNILIVDDNRDSAESLAIFLKMQGHLVKTAHDGPEALRMLASFRPRLIVLDLGLPGMSGYEVARRIRESEELKHVTLVALTGWGQEEDRRRTREAGFDHHMVKPADLDELERIVVGIHAQG